MGTVKGQALRCVWKVRIGRRIATVLLQVMVWTRGGRNNQGPVFRDFAAWSFSRSPRAPAPIAGWQSWTVERCQQRRVVSPQYISQSSEIWDRYRAWLESWILKWPCTSGGIFLTNPPVCQQPSAPSRCSLCQSVFVYISWIDRCLGQGNHQLHKESRGGDSGLHVGLLQHLKPYG